MRNIELAELHYPGWNCRFYLDDSVPQEYLMAIVATGAEIVKVTKPSLGPMYGRYWRLWVAADANVDRFIVRDADSRVNPREKAAVEEWISSGKTFHIMRDHHCHITRALAGMWGGVGGKLENIEQLIDNWGQYDRWGQCDRFVSEVLFPLMQDDYICHDGVGIFSDGRPFPPHPPLTGTRYVGEIVEAERPPIDIWRQSAEFENLLFAEIAQTKNLLEKIAALNEQLQRSEDDRSARLEQIMTLTKQLEISEADRAARLDKINILTAELAAATESLRDLGQLACRVQGLEHEIAALKRSTSWWTPRLLRRHKG